MFVCFTLTLTMFFCLTLIITPLTLKFVCFFTLALPLFVCLTLTVTFTLTLFVCLTFCSVNQKQTNNVTVEQTNKISVSVNISVKDTL